MNWDRVHYREKANTAGVSIPPVTLSTNLASRPFVFTLLWHCSFPCVPFVSPLVKLFLRHLGFFDTFPTRCFGTMRFWSRKYMNWDIILSLKKNNSHNLVHIQSRIKCYNLFPGKYLCCVNRNFIFSRQTRKKLKTWKPQLILVESKYTFFCLFSLVQCDTMYTAFHWSKVFYVHGYAKRSWGNRGYDLWNWRRTHTHFYTESGLPFMPAEKCVWFSFHHVKRSYTSISLVQCLLLKMPLYWRTRRQLMWQPNT